LVENNDPKNYARRLVKGSTIVFAAFIASELVGFFLRMFLARNLTVAEYGLFYAVFSLISFFSVFRDLGLGSSLVKYIPEFTVNRQFSKIKSAIISVLLIQALSGLFVSAVLFALSDQMALIIFKNSDAALLLKILSIWFFVAAIYPVMQTTFQGFQNMPAYASINFFNLLAIFLLTVFFVSALKFGIGGVALAYLLGAVVASFFGLILFARSYRHIFQKKTSITKSLLKKLFSFGLPLLIGSVAGLIISYTDTLMITIFRSLSEVGFYQAAQPTARILWYFPSALGVVLFPMISELWAKKERKLLREALHFLTKFSFILIIPAAFIFIVFPEIVINLLFGPGYLAGATALQILSAAAVIYTPYLVLAEVMRGIGKTVVLLKTTIIMACFNLFGNLALIPPYGIEGAAVATFLAHLLGFILLLYYARKLVRFTVPASSLTKTALGGFFTLLFIFSLKTALELPPWPEAFAVMIPSLVFYMVWILATKAITKEDLKLIAKIIPIPKWLTNVAKKMI